MRRFKPIEFHRTKYGPELLIDVAWVHDMPTFITDTPHVLAFFDIMLVTRGRGAFLLDGERHVVRAGTLLFTAPGQVRDWRVSALDGICLFFPATFLDDFFADASFVERLPFFRPDAAGGAMHLTPHSASRLRARLVAMQRELRSFRRDSVDVLRAQLHATLVTLARHYESRRGAPERTKSNPIVARYRELIERHVHEQHQVSFYANRLGLTAGHLNALCRRFAARTAKQLLVEVLSLRARRLLLYSDRSSAEIGDSLGFDDPSYFSRFVRRATGKSPSAFRVGR